MDFASGGNQAYLTHLIDGGAEAIMVQEAKDFRLADLLPAGWKALQDTSGDAKQGSAIAVDTSALAVDRWWLVKACDAPAGGGMLPRYLCCAELAHTSGQSLTAISAHAPPPRYDHMQPGFNSKLAQVCDDYPDAVVGADANMDIDKFAQALGPGMRAYGKQSGICLVSALPLSDTSQDHTGEAAGQTDHPAVWGSVGADQ